MFIIIYYLKMINIVTTTKSNIKLEAIYSFFESIKVDINLFTNDVIDESIPEQPFNSGYECCMKRIEYIEKNKINRNYDFILSIESSLESIEDNICDKVFIIMKDTFGNIYKGTSFEIKVKEYYYNYLLEESDELHLGFKTTLGEVINKFNPHIDRKNWMKDPEFGEIDRIDQIIDGLKNCYFNYISSNLKKNLLYFENFPKENVTFKDLSAIIYNPTHLNNLALLCCYKLLPLLDSEKTYKFIGLDARGFIYGPLIISYLKLLYNINCGFIMLRKKGKLPGNTFSIKYGTEYSISEVEVMEGLIKKEDNIIIVDDLVATGGSLEAGKKVVNRYDANLICCIIMVAVEHLLEDAKKLLNNTKILVAIK